MAITLGTPTNSGNRTNSTGFTLAHTNPTNTTAMVAIVTGYDSSATDSAVSSIMYEEYLMYTVGYYRSGSGFIGIYYIIGTALGVYQSGNVILTMGGTCTDLQLTVISLVSLQRILLKTYSSLDSSTTTHTITLNNSVRGSIMLGGIVALTSAVGNLSVTTGNEISGSEADMGNQVVGCAYAYESGGSNTITWTKSSAVASYALVSEFYEDGGVTIVPNEPNDGSVVNTTTPDLKFTGTDPDSDTIEYVVKISTVSTNNGHISEEILNITGAKDIAINTITNDIYVAVQNNDIYKQTGGQGNFNALSAGTIAWQSVVVNETNGDVWAVGTNSYIYKQTGGNGSFNQITSVLRNWRFIDVNYTTGDIYATTSSSRMYKLDNGTNTEYEVGGTRNWFGVTIDQSTNDVYASTYSGGGIYKQTNGTGDFVYYCGLNAYYYGIAINQHNKILYSSVNGNFIEQFLTNGDRDISIGTHPHEYSISINHVTNDIYIIYAGSVKRLSISRIAVSTVDNGFTTGHPFDSGSQVTYTVQEPLNAGTYYWYVYAYNPTIPNTYITSSSTKSFTISVPPQSIINNSSSLSASISSKVSVASTIDCSSDVVAVGNVKIQISSTIDSSSNTDAILHGDAFAISTIDCNSDVTANIVSKVNIDLTIDCNSDIVSVLTEKASYDQLFDALAFTLNGSPWYNKVASGSADVDSLIFSINGSPWWAVKPTTTALSLECSVSAHIVTANDVTFSVTRSYTLTCDVQTYQLTGIATEFTVLRNYSLVADTRSYQVNTIDTTFVVQRNYIVPITVGQILVNTNEILSVVVRNYTLTATVTSFLVSTVNATFSRVVSIDTIIDCSSAIQAATNANKELMIDPVSFSLSGQDSVFAVKRSISSTIDSSSSVTVTLSKHISLAVEVINFLLTGNQQQTNITHEVTNTQFTLAAADVNFTIQRNYQLIADTQSVVITGIDNVLTLNIAYSISVVSASFNITGNQISNSGFIRSMEAVIEPTGVVDFSSESIEFDDTYYTFDDDNTDVNFVNAIISAHYLFAVESYPITVNGIGTDFIYNDSISMDAATKSLTINGNNATFNTKRNISSVIQSSGFIDFSSGYIEFDSTDYTFDDTNNNVGFVFGTLTRRLSISTDPVAFNLTGNQTTFNRVNYIPVTVVSFNVNTVQASFAVKRSISASIGGSSSVNAAGNSDKSIDCETGTFIISGTDIAVNFKRVISAVIDNSTDLAVTVNKHIVLNAELGSYSVSYKTALLLTTDSVGSMINSSSDVTATIRKHIRLDVTAVSFVLSGINASVNPSYSSQADNVTFNVTATNTTFAVKRAINLIIDCSTDITASGKRLFNIDCSTASFIVNGNEVSFNKDLTYNASVTEYIINGVQVGFEALDNYSLGADTNQTNVNGSSITFDISYGINKAEYHITGNDVLFALQRNYTLQCSVGSFNVSTIVTDLLIGRSLNADVVSFIVSTVNKELILGRVLNTDTVTYLLNGIDATFAESQQSELATETATYIVTGNDAVLTVENSLGTGEYVLHGNDVILIFNPRYKTKPLKYYNGVQWVEKDLKYYDQGEWKVGVTKIVL